MELLSRHSTNFTYRYGTIKKNANTMINFTHIIAGGSGKNSGYRFLTNSILGDIKRVFVFELK
ncbi:hypothetical protein [Candidatus Methanoperedens nitratireducens]|uniref:Uncharacterized protein n=1 Tax=Candidatus Methanoperedens nitratireducens TaxID=1392998 RepID=A0A284VT60_9EURY|nr:hypothetical protein [Candidatus Methanoperedens nitroreducens]SNQ62377.1 hypothetical protein MNV_700031 [Candidatus Methanoperedens nitroreducens]